MFPVVDMENSWHILVFAANPYGRSYFVPCFCENKEQSWYNLLTNHFLCKLVLVLLCGILGYFVPKDNINFTGWFYGTFTVLFICVLQRLFYEYNNGIIDSKIFGGCIFCTSSNFPGNFTDLS